MTYSAPASWRRFTSAGCAASHSVSSDDSLRRAWSPNGDVTLGLTYRPGTSGVAETSDDYVRRRCAPPVQRSVRWFVAGSSIAAALAAMFFGRSPRWRT